MAKRKAKRKDRTEARASTRSRWWQVVLGCFLVGLFYWQWPTMSRWAEGVREDIVNIFGWGLLLIVIAIAVIVAVVKRQQIAEFARRHKLYQWNRWLGGTSLTFGIWGILAFADLGGVFGLKLIGYPDLLTGILRVIAFLVAGVVLVAPRQCLQAVRSFAASVRKQLHKEPKPRPATQQRPLSSSTGAVAEPENAQAEREVTVPVVARPQVVTGAQPQQDLRQVAQEVWKKYGESPALVTIDGWRLPPIDILDRIPEAEFSEADNLQRAKLIEEALDSYGVEGKVVQINAGPTVTQFGVEPGWDRRMKEVRERDRDGNVSFRLEEMSKTRVKVERITSLSNDLALALAAPNIRIEAPVPGKSIVGIEVPNTDFGLVSLRGVIETSIFQKLEARSKLCLALGKGAGGEAVAADLAKMPHLLIAGATGSGKTVCLNSTICCLLLYNTPDEVRFIMIDPKRVELTSFNSIPHLAAPVIVDTDKALTTLRWLNREMDQRYKTLATAGARSIDIYNRTRQGSERMPFLVLVIDELADLMMTGFDEVEHILCRLAQLARAVGIHLIVATQRPSVDVVTGLIKANFPTRISFAVTSQVDSRTILDMGGAEKLLGRGDMLFMPTEAAKPKRLQGCYVSDTELERLVYFWGSQKKEEPVEIKIEEVAAPTKGRREEAPEDTLMETARKLAQEHEHISTSFLQRRLRIGYPRAARIMEQLEEEGIKKEEGT